MRVIYTIEVIGHAVIGTTDDELDAVQEDLATAVDTATWGNLAAVTVHVRRELAPDTAHPEVAR